MNNVYENVLFLNLSKLENSVCVWSGDVLDLQTQLYVVYSAVLLQFSSR